MAYLGNSPGVASQRVETAFTATSNQTAFTPSSGYTLGYCDVYQNGVKLVNGDDYTASDGATVTLATGAASGDSIVIVASFPRGLTDGYLKSEADAKYALIASPTFTGVATFAKGTSNGITIGDVSTNSNSVLRLHGTSAGRNWQIANNLNVAGIEFTPSTANGGTTYTTPTVTFLSSGNVGVGTSSPATKLEVVNTAASTTSIQVNNASASSGAYSQFLVKSDAATGYFGASGSGNAVNGGLYDGDFVYLASENNASGLNIGTGSGQAIKFFTNGSSSSNERMRIDSSGNLLLNATVQAYSAKVLRSDNENAAVQSLLVRNNNSGSLSSCGYFLNSYGNSWGIEMGSTAKNSNALTFSVDVLGSPVERMRLDTAGTLSLTKASSILAVFGDTSNANDKYIRIGNSGGNFEIGTYSLAHYIYGIGSLPLSFYQNSTERIRIDTSGNVLVGTASAGAGIGWATRFAVESGTGGPYAAAFKSGAAGYAYECIDCWNIATTNNNVFINFYTEATTTFRGQITYNRGAGQISYGVSSDYRAKDIVGAFSNALDAVGQITVHLGKMKGSTFERPMFIAHELQAITPYAVMGEKDSVDEDGDPVYQQVDNLTLIPLLTAAIQEQQAIIEQLQADVATLKGTP